MDRSGSDPIHVLSGHFLEVMAKTTNKSIAEQTNAATFQAIAGVSEPNG